MTPRLARRLAFIICFLAPLHIACSANRVEISGEDVRHAEIVHGEIGIRGEENHITLLPGSDVTKLSIIGDENEVYVENGATLEKIEIIGEDNEVSCPPDVHPAWSTIGEDNRLRHRSRPD